jgi:hypothetical protein
MIDPPINQRIWLTHSTCLNDQLDVKMQRIVTARPMSTHCAAQGTVTLLACPERLRFRRPLSLTSPALAEE